MSFPDENDRTLIEQATRVHSLAAGLDDWADRFGPSRREKDPDSFAAADELAIAQLRRITASLLESARLPVAAAVYGPSQAGKSLFVGKVLTPSDPDRSPLGKDERHGQPGYLPGLSFETDLNPQSGSNEATAVVTRFSTNDRLPGNLPPEFPVVARALSRGQLLRVLARGFAVECAAEHTCWNGAAIVTLLAELGRRYPASKQDATWRRDLLDAYAYMRRCDARRFEASEQELAAALTEHALTREGFVDLAGHLFWDRWRSLTGLFLRVEEFLASLDASDHEPGLLIGWPAVRFLLDSKRAAVHECTTSRCFQRVTWSDFRLVRRGTWPVLEHCPESSAYREPLETIQAALFELVVPVLPHRLRDDWRAVLAQSDILDIPGLRAGRQGAEQGKRTSADTLDEQLEILKRGKVAYLFEHYNEQSQIHSLLLLARGGNLEVTASLKHHVDLWGKVRYGATNWPNNLPTNTSALFMGLTGVDEEFRHRGEFAEPTLYDSRLAQLTDALGPVIRPCGDANAPSTNIFLLRYPGTWDTTAAQQQREGPEKWTRAAQAFLASSAVRRYIAEPAEKWATAMRDDDGGLSVISAGWRAQTTPQSKQQHLATQLTNVHKELLHWGGRLAINSDGSAERNRRMDCAQQVLLWLMADASSIHERVNALKGSLGIAEAALHPLADATEHVHDGHRRRSLSRDRFGELLRNFLHTWATRHVVENWQRHVQLRRNSGTWLNVDEVGRLAVYLRDYFYLPAIFDCVVSRLWKVVSLRLRDESAQREVRHRYVGLILNDLIWNPGLEAGAQNGASDSVADANAGQFGSMAPLVRRWRRRLPEALAAGAGDAVEIPPGNEELNHLLCRSATP